MFGRGWSCHIAAETWWVEIFGLALSITSLGLIAVLLGVFDGKPTFDWHHVTLNAIIAICATALRGGVLFAVGSALGQWKWERFAVSPTPLNVFGSLDSASRNVLGGLELIWRTRGL